MHSQKHKNSSSVAELRQQAGLWLREKREAAGLSQRELANLVGFEYYTFISQIESGRGKVPSDRFEAYAQAINVSPRDFAITMLRYNDVYSYDLIFGDVHNVTTDANALEERLRLLEAKLAD